MPDVIEHLHGCIFQHGDSINRVDFRPFNPEARRYFGPALDVLAEEMGDPEVTAKIPVDSWRFSGRRPRAHV